MVRHLALYGKGGVGKTTLAANVGAALAEAGAKVLLVGCDFKADTGALVHGLASVPTLLDHASLGRIPQSQDIVTTGYLGVSCIEVGDSVAGGECTARSIGRGLALLFKHKIIEDLAPDHVIYDIPWETACSGLTHHCENFPSHHAVVVASGDLQSFHTANALFRILKRQKGCIGASIVGNAIAGKFEEAFVEDFAKRTKSTILAYIPRSLVVRHCELFGKTVIEAAAQSNQAQLYRKVARHLADVPEIFGRGVPNPLPGLDLKEWARGWGECLGELEFGIISDGGGI